MAQCIKHPQSLSMPTPKIITSDRPASQTGCRNSNTQPSMQRHVHTIPLREKGETPQSTQQTLLLRALEQQTNLLTELLSAVNGLTALLCSRSPH